MFSLDDVPVECLPAFNLLEVLNPARKRITCVGHAPSKNRRCENPIGLHKVNAAYQILERLFMLPMGSQQSHKQLHYLAILLSCGRHAVQADRIAAGWHRVLRSQSASCSAQGDYQQHRPTGPTAGFPQQPPRDQDLWEEMCRLRREMDEILRQNRDLADRLTARRRQEAPAQPAPAASQNCRDQHKGAGGDASSATANAQAGSAQGCGASDRRSEQHEHARTDGAGQDQVRQEEARREEARREEARREEARREEALQEQRRQEQARQEEALRQSKLERKRQEDERQRNREREEKRRREEEARQRLAREARARARERRQSWADAWTRYERDWNNLSVAIPIKLAEDVRDTLPWPVLDGKWQSVNEHNVKTFFTCVQPGEASKRSAKETKKFFNAQAMRWHHDQIAHKFQELIKNAETMALATLVMQVINACKSVV